MPAGKSSLILWGVATARTIRPHWAMHELGLDYQIRPIRTRTPDMETAEYTALNARQKIPLLQDGDLTITESVAIVAYLSDAYGRDDNRLVPTDARARATCMEWCLFAATELDATSLYVLRRHDSLKHIYGEAPKANEAAIAYFHKQMRSVERALSDGRRYITGDRFSAADIVLATTLTWAGRYGVTVSDAALAYEARANARPAFATATAANNPPVAAA